MEKYINYPVYGQTDYFNKPQNDFHQHVPYYSVNNNKLQHQFDAGKQKTLDPIVTGTSVLAVKYNGGVVMGTDMLCSYGSLARFNDIQRMKLVGSNTIVGAGGEYSDFQALSNLLDDLVIEDSCIDDGSKLSSKEIWNYLARVLYNQRNKGNPYWNSLVVAGFQDGKEFLGKVDLVGTCYQDDYIATGYGAHIALPLIRKAWDLNPNGLTEQAAIELIEKCLTVLFYRDARSSRKVQVSVVSSSGTKILPSKELETYNWLSGEAAVKNFKDI